MMFQKKDNTEIEQLRKELQESKKKADENLAGWKRALADFANFKKEQEARSAEFIQWAHEDLILDLLPILDNFEAAFKAKPRELEKNSWIKGIGHIKSQLENLLKNRGIEEIGKAGEEFDPLVYEAVEKVGHHESGTSNQEKKLCVYKVMQKGYKLNGKVIRSAKVIVGIRK